MILHLEDDQAAIRAPHLAFTPRAAHIRGMATASHTITGKNQKPAVLGRSAATGRNVLAPVVTKKKLAVSDKRITAAVKGVHAKKK